MPMTVARFQTLDNVIDLISGRNLTPVRAGPYIIGVADPSVLESPARLAQYIRQNVGTPNILFFTRWSENSYNQVAANAEILSRAERIESGQVRIRRMASDITPQRVPASQGPAAQPPQPVQPPQTQTPPPQEEARPEIRLAEEGVPVRALVFEYQVDSDRLGTIMHTVNNSLDTIVHSQDQEVQRLIGLDGLLDRYGFRGSGHLAIRVNLDVLRAAGHQINEAEVERDMMTNPGRVLSYFVELGVPSAVEIRQTQGASGGVGLVEQR